MIIPLKHLDHASSPPLCRAIEERRSCREFLDTPVTSDALSLLLRAAQGRTGAAGQRAAPSAASQYPVQTYVAIGNATMPSGLYHYQPSDHTLSLLMKNDLREALCDAAIGQQPWIGESALIIVLSAHFDLVRNHFHDQPPRGKRGERYIFLETGAIVQNVYLQATACALGAVLVGGFDDDKVAKILNLPDHLQPTALIAVGTKQPTPAQRAQANSPNP